MLQPRLRVLIHKDEVFAALIIASHRPMPTAKESFLSGTSRQTNWEKVLPQKWRRVIMLTCLQFGALFFQGKQINPRDVITNSITGLPYT
jgi:hypothetical protein